MDESARAQSSYKNRCIQVVARRYCDRSHAGTSVVIHVLLTTGPAFRVHRPMKNHFVCYWLLTSRRSNTYQVRQTWRCSVQQFNVVFNFQMCSGAEPSNEHFPMGTITSMFCLCNICASPRRNLSYKCTR